MIARYLSVALIGIIAALCALWALDEYGLRFGHIQKWGADFWIVNVEGDRAHIARLQGDLASVKQASDDAVRLQMAASEAVEARYSTLAKETDDAHRETLVRVRDAVSAYARDHNAGRMCARADRGSPGPALAPAEDVPAPSSDSLGPDAVVLSRSDFDILTGNTVRLAAVHDWGEKLIEDGLASDVAF